MLDVLHDQIKDLEEKVAVLEDDVARAAAQAETYEEEATDLQEKYGEMEDEHETYATALKGIRSALVDHDYHAAVYGGSSKFINAVRNEIEGIDVE